MPGLTQQQGQDKWGCTALSKSSDAFQPGADGQVVLRSTLASCTSRS